MVVVVGGMRPNTATSRSFAFAFASTTLSIWFINMILQYDIYVEAHYVIYHGK